MPAQEHSHRFQDALLWPNTGNDAHGQPTVGALVELKVRWTWKSRLTAGAQGNPVSTDATVVTDHYILPGSAMWEGALVDWLGTGSNDADTQVMEVVSCDSTPDLKNRVVGYMVGLAFYKTVPPDVTG